MKNIFMNTMALAHNISPIHATVLGNEIWCDDGTYNKTVMTPSLGTKTDQGKPPQNLEEQFLAERHFLERENFINS